MDEVSEKTQKSLILKLREQLFAVYAKWLGNRLASSITGDLIVGNQRLEQKRLGHDDRAILDDFFNSKVEETDLLYSGVKSKKYNFNHPCFVYLGIFDADELAAVGTIKVIGRNTIERTLLVSKDWRRKGIQTSWRAKNEVIRHQHKIDLQIKINENNEVMLGIYDQSGIRQDHKEGNLIVFKLPYSKD